MDLEREICSVICRSKGIKAKEISKLFDTDRKEINQILYGSPLLQELCFMDRDHRWHGIMSQERPHIGLQEYAGYYSLAGDFLELSEEKWLEKLSEGCNNIGRSLNDTRGLFHSFRDCREQIVTLLRDLKEMLGEECLDWEVAFELRLKRSKYIRIYCWFVHSTSKFNWLCKRDNEVHTFIHPLILSSIPIIHVFCNPLFISRKIVFF